MHYLKQTDVEAKAGIVNYRCFVAILVADGYIYDDFSSAIRIMYTSFTRVAFWLWLCLREIYAFGMLSRVNSCIFGRCV